MKKENSAQPEIEGGDQLRNSNLQLGHSHQVLVSKWLDVFTKDFANLSNLYLAANLH